LRGPSPSRGEVMRRGGAALGASVLLAALLGSVSTGAQQGAAPQACDNPDRSVTLYAKRIAPGRVGYGLTPSSASIPGPTLEMTEGECLAVRLLNRTNKRVSVHSHGVDYTVASDGTRLNASCTKPGGSRTYLFSAHGASTRGDGTVEAGSAGYWHYHDHCSGSPHGTGGINAGLFGAFIVRRSGDPLPDRKPFVIVMGPGVKINLRSAPRTPVFRANEGERVEFVVITHGDLFHTFHLHGHRWADNRTGIPASTDDPVQVIDNRTSGPADSFGFQVIAGERVGPGAWMYHCHVQGHSDLGMTGLFVVGDPAGRLTAPTRAALRGWRQHSASHGGH
ncbi:MAG: multicopper oxidase domain-containing protein, partial [Actinomycetota bacterium]|nr:multicopper oxidase domain-containing protein [Actinomycetota bacterium]